MVNLAYALADGLFISIFSIAIVFTILLVMTYVVHLMKHIKDHNVPHVPLIQTNKTLSIDDITDEDMMVAALVASIDYQDITKSDVRVTSIKEIK